MTLMFRCARSLLRCVRAHRRCDLRAGRRRGRRRYGGRLSLDLLLLLLLLLKLHHNLLHDDELDQVEELEAVDHVIAVTVEHRSERKALLLGERGRVGRHEADNDGCHLHWLELAVLVHVELVETGEAILDELIARKELLYWNRQLIADLQVQIIPIRKAKGGGV